MGLIQRIFGLVSGGGVARAVEVFRPNAEADAARGIERYLAALAQFAAEGPGAGRFGRFVDGLNRLPRPAMAFGVIGLFVFCMVDPEAFSVRVSALALVPAEMWWLLGAVVSFYFGAREVQKGREGRVARAVEDLATWRAGAAAMRSAHGGDPAPGDPAPPASIDPAEAAVMDENPALAALRRSHATKIAE